MAKVVVTMKIMPESTDINLDDIEKQAKEKITAFAGETEQKTDIEPIAFGLKALKILFVMDESKGSTEFLETQINDIPGIKSVDVTDVRRAIG